MAVGVCSVVCFRPLNAYRDVGGGIAFGDTGSGAANRLKLACGQCVGCRAERARQWAIRCVHEASLHDQNCFITLTYSGEKLPPDGSLRIEDWQRFAKRLRKKVGKFRYFMCGEYGEVNFRPHYHACMFGVDWPDKECFRVNGRGDRLYVSPLLESTWGHGLVSSGNLSYESAAYVARYVMKKATGPLASKRYGRVDIETGECWAVKPEFVAMSRRPGIASKWFDMFGSDVYPEDEVVFDGRRFRPPRFYDNKLDKFFLEELKVRRRERVGKRLDDLTPDRLAVRERVAVSRLTQLDRDL